MESQRDLPGGPPTGPFPVTSQGGPGLTAAQVRNPRFVAPSRGIRIPRDVADRPAARESAAVLLASPTSALCDVAAAGRWGFPLPPWLDQAAQDAPVPVAVPAGSSRQRRRGVRGRRLVLPAEHLVTDRHGVTLTSPARTWLDCAELMTVEHVVAMGDVVLRRGLASADDLARMVRWGRGRRGVVDARRALRLLDAGSESPAESIVRCHLVLEGIPRPVCNMNIVWDGEWLARADLVWPVERVIVEYDGARHGDQARRRTDATRRNLLQQAGWLVIVFTADDLRRPWAMAQTVRSALRARAPRP